MIWLKKTQKMIINQITKKKRDYLIRWIITRFIMKINLSKKHSLSIPYLSRKRLSNVSETIDSIDHSENFCKSFDLEWEVNLKTNLEKPIHISQYVYFDYLINRIILEYGRVQNNINNHINPPQKLNEKEIKMKIELNLQNDN